MKLATVLRHLAFEDLGLLEAPLAARGYVIETVDAGVDADPARLAASDLLVICGGPIGVYEIDRYPYLEGEIQATATRLAAGRPTLGICLGAQLMAAALGARVYPGGRKELGWGPLQLTAAGKHSPLAVLEGLPVLHWHGDTFDLPAGATHLAASPVYPHQAFAVGRHGLALQFHVEADPARIEQWLIGHTGELSVAGIDIPGLRAATLAQGPAMVKAAPALLERWLEGLVEQEPA